MHLLLQLIPKKLTCAWLQNRYISVSDTGKRKTKINSMGD